MDTYCYQCEQSAAGKGCVSVGNCGKDPRTSALQDLAVHAVKGIAMWAHRAAQLGAHDDRIGRAVVDGLFTTVTNVNFDPERVATVIRDLAGTLEQARRLYRAACDRAGKRPEELAGPAAFVPAPDLAGLEAQVAVGSIQARLQRQGADLTGLQELLLYGVKGVAAYAHHATVLGKEDREVYAWFYEALDLLTRPGTTADALLGAALRCGEVNLKVMEMLDGAHTDTFGHPTPTTVRITPVAGKAILVTGHDMEDLAKLLQQTEGTGVQVYTHGEMLTAHSYPELRKYAHLVGNYGGAWQDQVEEFDAFPGAVLFTTNCLQAPRESYKGRIFTTGLVAFPGVKHVERDDFSQVVAAAKAAPGFVSSAPEKRITIGFGHKAVLGVADKVIAGVKSGAIKRFFLVGGCDGAKTGRNYYTDFAKAVPKDCVILTLACGKYRFNKLEFGDIGGIPRLLDLGQCNDAYSAIRIAGALAEAFGTDVNGLPLSLVLSWYEQKAVAILLTLFHLGIRNIRLGPTLPQFVTPAALDVLVKKFAVKPITTVEADLSACMAGA
jgi:hydroxylamine reductase